MSYCKWAIAALSRILFTWQNPIITHNVSIILAPQSSNMVSQAGLLNSAYFFVWGGLVRLGSTNDAQYLAESNRLWDFKFSRVVRLQYLVSLYICYVLLNVRDKNPLYSILYTLLLVTVMRIQLFHGTVKYCNSHIC